MCVVDEFLKCCIVNDKWVVVYVFVFVCYWFVRCVVFCRGGVEEFYSGYFNSVGVVWYYFSCDCNVVYGVIVMMWW